MTPTLRTENKRKHRSFRIPCQRLLQHFNDPKAASSVSCIFLDLPYLEISHFFFQFWMLRQNSNSNGAMINVLSLSWTLKIYLCIALNIQQRYLNSRRGLWKDPFLNCSAFFKDFFDHCQATQQCSQLRSTKETDYWHIKSDIYDFLIQIYAKQTQNFHAFSSF